MTAKLFRTLSVSLVAAGACNLLAVRSAGAEAISVAWDPTGETISGYAVYVGTQSGVYTQRHDVSGATAFTFTGASAGQRYCFAVASYLSESEGPKSSEVCGYSNAPPSLVNPGNQSSSVGQPVTLQLVGSDPASQPLTYSATGLPGGLTVMASTGLISGTGTSQGTYAVIARAFDGALYATQSFTWTMATAPVVDTTPPTITISGPTTSPTYPTTSATVSLTGSSADNKAVSVVSWSSDRGGSGGASGTTSWTTPSIVLQSGVNVITVTARDAAGNQANDVLTVTYDPPVAAQSVLLFGEPVLTHRSKRQVRLTWTQAPWTGVWVYRNGTRVARTSNDGSHVDSVRSGGAYNYRICAPGGTICSNTITIYF